MIRKLRMRVAMWLMPKDCAEVIAQAYAPVLMIARFASQLEGMAREQHERVLAQHLHDAAPAEVN